MALRNNSGILYIYVKLPPSACWSPANVIIWFKKHGLYFGGHAYRGSPPHPEDAKITFFRHHPFPQNASGGAVANFFPLPCGFVKSGQKYYVLWNYDDFLLLLLGPIFIFLWKWALAYLLEAEQNGEIMIIIVAHDTKCPDHHMTWDLLFFLLYMSVSSVLPSSGGPRNEDTIPRILVQCHDNSISRLLNMNSFFSNNNDPKRNFDINYAKTLFHFKAS